VTQEIARAYNKREERGLDGAVTTKGGRGGTRLLRGPKIGALRLALATPC